MTEASDTATQKDRSCEEHASLSDGVAENCALCTIRQSIQENAEAYQKMGDLP